jgi:hypothetical protein
VRNFSGPRSQRASQGGWLQEFGFQEFNQNPDLRLSKNVNEK